MPFTIEEFRDLVRLLGERPEWREELRRLVLTDELLTLPELVRSLAEAQRRTEERLGGLEEHMAALEEHMAALAEAQRRTEERLGGLEERVERLGERVDRLEEAMTTLAQRVADLTMQVSYLTGVVRTLVDDVGELKGDALERRYRERGFAYFAPSIRRARVLSGDELEALLESAVDRGQLSEPDTRELTLADLVIRGRRRADDIEVFLVVEVSWGVGPQDVQRAVHRATLLSQTGVTAIPVVAGREITAEASGLARAMRAWRVMDGQVIAPEL